MKRVIVTVFVSLALVSLAFAQMDYDTEVQTIFNSRCISCHGTSGGVTLTSYASTIASVGNKSGMLVISPGDKENSPLYNAIGPNPQYVSRMPTMGGYLSDDQINTIGQWIDEGALETPSSVASEMAQPDDFSLISSYPNPFNPTTTIRFTLSVPSPITLTVYDLKGRPIHTHQSNYAAGSHEVQMMLSHLASGMYVVRMQAISGSNLLTSNALKIMMMK